MAIEHSDLSPRRHDTDEFRDETLPKNMLIPEIKLMMAAYKGDRMPYRSVIGKFDMKGFPRSRMMPPAQAHRIKKLAENN